jgi:hypothetical protein
MSRPLDAAVPARAGDAGTLASLRQHYKRLAHEALMSEQTERKMHADEAGALDELRQILQKLAADAVAKREAQLAHRPARPGSLADLRAHIEEIVSQAIEEMQSLGAGPRILSYGDEGINVLV